MQICEEQMEFTEEAQKVLGGPANVNSAKVYSRYQVLAPTLFEHLFYKDLFIKYLADNEQTLETATQNSVCN